MSLLREPCAFCNLQITNQDRAFAHKLADGTVLYFCNDTHWQMWDRSLLGVFAKWTATVRSAGHTIVKTADRLWN